LLLPVVPVVSPPNKRRQAADNDGRQRARLLEISRNNATVPSDWKKAIVVPIYKGGDRSAVTNCRPISLTTVVCKQLENVIEGYLREVWDKNVWLYEGDHGFRPGYSCENQVITVCQDTADCLDDAVGIDAIDKCRSYTMVRVGVKMSRKSN
jgi:hypothetical protein